MFCKKVFNFIKKATLAQVFSCEFCHIFKNSFFYRTPLLTAFDLSDCRIPNQFYLCKILSLQKNRLNHMSLFFLFSSLFGEI